MSTTDDEMSHRKPGMTALPELLVTVAVFLIVLWLVPISEGYAFPLSPPPELVALSQAAFCSAAEICSFATPAQTGPAGGAPSYVAASIGPNLRDIAPIDRDVAMLLAGAVALVSAMNFALVRHVRGTMSMARR
ncbi:MAG TPA: hypothetical protein PK970_11020 [Hyphomicrobiaceae bacterium]|nr:hypothetical protein [Hyphomicrobiaceae bacterium]